METGNIWRLYGHPSAATASLSNALGAPVSEVVDSEIAAAIFAINASSGVDQKTVDIWHQFDELLLPRILVITGFNEGLQDFDDAVVLAKRLLDDVATPVLVLHDDDGNPCALIDLDTLKINNYRTGEITDADPEHLELVADFREEYLAQKEAAGEDGFISGIFFPAIPVLLNDPEFNLGVDIVKKYLSKLPSLS
ncbi:MAG: hypothetical protein ACR2H8_04195 [Candidatus Nanopelagicaceae bacterium]